MSGYAFCACRDCVEVTVSSDETKPELCTRCFETGCVLYAPPTVLGWPVNYDCQRDDGMERMNMSGYAYCACRDCLGVPVSSDETKPELCSECSVADCSPDNSLPGYIANLVGYECQREDAYREVEA